MADYVAGATVRLTYTSLVNGVATNAATVSVTIQRPDGQVDGPYTLLAAQVVKSGTGNYRYDYTTSSSNPPGQYVVVWQSNLSTVRNSFDLVRGLNPQPVVWNLIARKCAADVAPTLSDDDLDQLVSIARRADGSYNINKAAAEGWRWKAARAAGGFSFAADGTSVDKTMIIDHCLKMVDTYTKGQVRTVKVDTVLAPFETDYYRTVQS